MNGQCEFRGPIREGYEEILTPEALDFLAALTRRFRPRIERLLDDRAEKQQRIDAGDTFNFPPETSELRRSHWRVAPLPDDLTDRRVELTGPVDRKVLINGLNSGARCFMADFEDATSPTWDNLIQGQRNLRDAVRGTIKYRDDESGKEYALGPDRSVLFVRPRGLHLPEAHLRIDGRPVPGALFDFGLYFFHNAHALVAAGTAPYFYLPKLESYREAALWNEVFVEAQSRFELPTGTIKATVLIETLPAAFEMDEILYELKEHSAGLNCGRWDYIFSYAKKFRRDPSRVLPDRQQVTMLQPFMRAYTQRLIQRCHRRGVHAMGGMAPQIPRRHSQQANAAALEKVKADKLREVTDGHDGTWVAHPGLIKTAREVFDRHMAGPNQIARTREDLNLIPRDLLALPDGNRSEQGLRSNIRVGVRYLDAWLGGTAAVPIDGLMEDAATAEISRTQIWSWLTHGADVGGSPLTRQRFLALLDEEARAIGESADSGHLQEAVEIFRHLCLSEHLEEFLTGVAYGNLLTTK